MDPVYRPPADGGPETREETRRGAAVRRPGLRCPAQTKADGVGARVLASELFTAQREQFARPSVEDAGLTTLLDALAEAGGRLPVPVAAERAGQMPARMHGYISTVARLLNVDGYQVLAVTDGGRTVALDLPLLREQFLGGGG
ncbi:hypothetical protein [Actinomadura welshii]|uniref:hypothetical protein n=1 Tax=Actinomadura welshii TaxID=3103817 RepID=UPI0012689F6E|nr:hypothetical protein [Actinomadura madurae]